MSFVPHEFAIGGVFMPPLLIAWFLGLIAAVYTSRLLNKHNLSRHFFYTPLVFVSFNVIYTIIFSLFVVPG